MTKLTLKSNILDFTGNCWNSKEWIYDYCPSFKNVDGAKLTVHLDMNKGTMAFTVNATKHAEVSEYNLPSVLSLHHPGRVRLGSVIQKCPDIRPLDN